MDATQKIAVVTGGGTGMGKAIAGQLANSVSTVVIAGRREQVLNDAAAELTANGAGRVLPYRCDVTDPTQIDDLAIWLRESFGGTIDVLVNNAGGVAYLPTDASTSDAADYASRTLASNLTSAWLMTFALGPMLRRPGGRIVNLSSIAAFRGGGDMYSAAKAGVVGLTYGLAAELGPQGITVNAIAPGLVLGTEFFGDRMTDERRDRTVGQTPVGRPGAPEDIAAAVAYLASPEAGFVNGEVLHVNGGWVFGR
ncbi:MAG: SDR family oxidoreductase [Thermomicrobiales bacterium]|nr:SDR family oxidoreductase [Thermomicrobiales bacterium]